MMNGLSHQLDLRVDHNLTAQRIVSCLCLAVQMDAQKLWAVATDSGGVDSGVMSTHLQRRSPRPSDQLPMDISRTKHTLHETRNIPFENAFVPCILHQPPHTKPFYFQSSSSQKIQNEYSLSRSTASRTCHAQLIQSSNTKSHSRGPDRLICRNILQTNHVNMADPTRLADILTLTASPLSLSASHRKQQINSDNCAKCSQRAVSKIKKKVMLRHTRSGARIEAAMNGKQVSCSVEKAVVK